MTFPEYAKSKGVILTHEQEIIGEAIIKAINDIGCYSWMSRLGTGVTTMLHLLENYFKYEMDSRREGD